MMSEEEALACTDPEFVARFERFAFDEVVNEEGARLEDRPRFMAILAALIGCQGLDTYRVMLPCALEKGLTPVEVKEIGYQATAYCGMGRVLPFLTVTNEALSRRAEALPLVGQERTSLENRLEKGNEAQITIFGEQMRETWKSAPPETAHIQKWLADNCFGDYYTRGGLDLREREMITFCFLAAQGGCESQLTSHAAGNMRVGNDRAFLIRVISQCLPYIGYPRSLNALTCVNNAA
jgi:4-carboxymuconolactone decarboxylase